MSLIEFIGFIISLVALIVLYVKRVREDRYRRAHPEEFEGEDKEQGDQLRDFLRSIDMDMEDDKRRPVPPPPKPQQASKQKAVPKKKKEPVQSYTPARTQKSSSENYQHNTSVEDKKRDSIRDQRRLQMDINERHDDPFGKRQGLVDLSKPQSSSYEVIKISTRNRALESMKQLKSKKDLVILSEIINPPKALR